jgi:pimeloyl-ACP methyl ester carboxylesterase
MSKNTAHREFQTASPLSQHITLPDGRKLGFAEYGDPSGFPIIYCHGSQSSRLEMHYDMSFAVSLGLRILAVDRPGHGLSDFDPKASILSVADDVDSLIRHLNISKYSVVGMSAGGPFALGLAYRFPETIAKTAVIGSFAPFGTETKQYLQAPVRTMLNLAKHAPFLIRLFLKLQARSIKKDPRKALQGFIKLMSPSDQALLQQEPVMDVVESMFTEAFRNGSSGPAHEVSKILVQPWGFDLEGIRVPVTLWQGTIDQNVPHAWADYLASRLPIGELKSVPDEGHLLIFKHAEAIFENLKSE